MNSPPNNALTYETKWGSSHVTTGEQTPIEHEQILLKLQGIIASSQASDNIDTCGSWPLQTNHYTNLWNISFTPYRRYVEVIITVILLITTQTDIYLIIQQNEIIFGINQGCIVSKCKETFIFTLNLLCNPFTTPITHLRF